MAILSIDASIDELYGIGPKQREKLMGLDIISIRDLIFHLPRRYDDYSQVVQIRDLKPGSRQSTKGTVWKVEERRTRRGMFMLSVTIVDDTGVASLVWFNNRFLKGKFSEGDELFVSGMIELYRGQVTVNNPSYQLVDADKKQGESLHLARIVPVYSETAGITSRWLRDKVKRALELVAQVESILPSDTIKRQKLLPIDQALVQIHFPSSKQSLRQARERLAFEELFAWQLRGVLNRQKWQQRQKAARFEIKAEELDQFRQSLPFQLTDVQTRSIREILDDMNRPMPMNRLLEGDVGSGKTVVAAMGLLNSVLNGYQAVLMAPTEILAEQHYHSLVKLLEEFELTIGLITASKTLINNALLIADDQSEARKRNEFHKKVEDGEIDLLIGTHALIQEKVKFSKLGFVVIDEQHRFGVRQRAVLQQQDSQPDVLTMTATPIPRTLALAVYGDLDVSVLDQMPPGRKPVKTRLVPRDKRLAAYDFTRKHLDLGEQVFVICPLVEESTKLQVKSAVEEFEQLKRGPFKEFAIGLVHGRLSSKEKEQVMSDFKTAKLQILVSTAVVEVGVDIPGATVMLIEGADRFGMAQLHQFRGRVGRSSKQSFCLLFTDTENEEAIQRLELFEKSTDGFDLAEKDLKLRGPGEVYGMKQSGIPQLRVASLLDVQLIKRTRSEAVLALDNLDQYPQLKTRVQELEQQDVVLN